MEKKLPEGWEWKRLGDVATVGAGNSAPQGEQYFTDGTYPFVRTKDAGREKATICLVNTTDKVNNFAVKECKLKLLPAKTLLVPKSGMSTFLNHRALLGEPSYVSSHLATVIAGNDLLPEYLYFWSLTIDVKQLTHDINYPSLRLSELGSAKIPLPSIETQRKIVAVLEKAEETKKLKRQADGLTNQLLQSVFLEMFGDSMKNLKGWKIVTLEDTCKLIRDGGHRTPTYVEEGIPFVTAKNLVGGELDLGNTKKITNDEHADFCKRAKPEKGDLLMSKDGTIGVTRVIKTGDEFSIYVSVVLLKPNNEFMDANFLRYLLSSKTIQAEIVKRSKGSGLKHIHLVDLRSLKIPLPPFNIQKNFSKVVETVEAMRQNQKQSRQEIDNLFNALMQKAFEGELTT